MVDDPMMALRVFKVGSSYPYHIVVAGSEDEAVEVVKAMLEDPSPLLGGEGVGEARRGGPAWVVVELDTSKPGVIDTNVG